MFEHFVNICLVFQEKHPDRAKGVNHYNYLEESDAIEIQYRNGKRTVWDIDSDIEVIVVDV